MNSRWASFLRYYNNYATPRRTSISTSSLSTRTYTGDRSFGTKLCKDMSEVRFPCAHRAPFNARALTVQSTDETVLHAAAGHLQPNNNDHNVREALLCFSLGKMTCKELLSAPVMKLVRQLAKRLKSRVLGCPAGIIVHLKQGHQTTAHPQPVASATTFSHIILLHCLCRGSSPCASVASTSGAPTPPSCSSSSSSHPFYSNRWKRRERHRRGKRDQQRDCA